MSGAPTDREDNVKDEPSGTAARSEKSILSKLLFDEDDFLRRLEDTIQRALRWFHLEPRTGRVVLSDEAKRLRVRDQIRLLAAGRHFVKRLNLAEAEGMSYREIAEDLDRPPSGVSPELTALVRDGDLVRDEDGQVSMPFHRIEGVLAELEQAKPRVPGELESTSERPRRSATRRAVRQRTDPILQSLLGRPSDLSSYAWIKDLKTARDKGLAALLIAKDVYNFDELTCQQMAIFLTRKFPVKVTRAAINMGFLAIKSQYIAPIARGNEVAYSLLPLGREHIQKTAAEAQRSAGSSPTPG